MRQLPDSDWKMYRNLQDAALDRYCERALKALQELAAAPGQTNHARYLNVYRETKARDKELARVFSFQSRSNALIGLAAWRGAKLLTEEEYQAFSEDTRQAVSILLGNGGV